MGRIEYWLLGAVAALIAFIAFQSVKSTLEPHRYALQIEQAGHPRDTLNSAASDPEGAGESISSTAVDMHSAVRPSRAPAPARNPTEIRRRIEQLRAKQTEIDQRIEEQEATIELLQERATAAHRLRKTCEAWAAQHVQNGGVQGATSISAASRKSPLRAAKP